MKYGFCHAAERRAEPRVSAQEGFRMTWSDITFGTGSEGDITF